MLRSILAGYNGTFIQLRVLRLKMLAFQFSTYIGAARAQLASAADQLHARCLRGHCRHHMSPVPSGEPSSTTSIELWPLTEYFENQPLDIQRLVKGRHHHQAVPARLLTDQGACAGALAWGVSS